MPIAVFLQNIDGKRKEAVVADPAYCLARIWPCGDEAYPLLQYLDPYGDAIFNGLQMPQVLKELDVLVQKASTDEQSDILRKIRELAVTCQEHPHQFLRFCGD